MRALILYLLCALALQAQSPAQSHYLRGAELLRNQYPSQAIAELDEALKLDPQLAEAHDAKGLARLAQGDPTAALAEFRRALALKPRLAEAHLGMGLALGQSGELEAAAKEFRAAIAIRPAYAEAHKRLGVTLRRLGDEKAALAEFEKAVQSDPADPETWYYLGLARKSGNDTPGAVAAFRKAVELKPDYEKARYNLGIALRAAGREPAAAKELADVRGLHAFREKLTESKALIVRGVDALEHNRNDDALQCFTEASKLSPSLPTAWHYLGVAYYRGGDTQQALDAWNRALALEPDYPKTHAALGLMHARAGDFEAARREFQQAVSSDPDDAQAHYNLGLALANLKNLPEAAAELGEAVNLNPRYIEARVQLGLVLSAKGDLTGAANAYREVIRQHPDMPEAHNNLGLVLVQMNEFEAASREFHRALELNPGFAPAMQNMALTEPCQVTQPTATLVIPHVSGAPELNTDPRSPVWKNAAASSMMKDCSHKLDYPDLASEIRMFWTDTDLYLLFTCPYKKLNIWEPPQNDRPRNKLWDRDVVEFFLGSDWNEIRRYREFEIAPTGDWIDLAIDLSRRSYDRNWRSGWKTAARIDEAAHVWYAAARVPLSAVSDAPVKPGSRWRMNLYRIDGEGPDAKRHFLCWQPTCAGNRDPNHVPENFATLVFGPAR
jgi:tetratricopeptide (TPR) repeat protein